MMVELSTGASFRWGPPGGAVEQRSRLSRLFKVQCSKLVRSTPPRGFHSSYHLILNTMQKLSNFTGQARHGWERMTPAAFGMGRNGDNIAVPSSTKRSIISAPIPPLAPGDGLVTLSFNIPFASTLVGPKPEEVLHASPGAVQRWTFPEGTDDAPPYSLPVHTRNVEQLKRLCKTLTERYGSRLEASVTSVEAKSILPSQTLRKGMVTNVCITGESDLVHKVRSAILAETPIALVRLMRWDAQSGLIVARSVPSWMSIPNTSWIPCI